MGKTNPTYRDQYKRFWKEDTARWRQGLRQQNQDRWDRLLEMGQLYSVAGDNLNATDIRWPIVYSMLLALQKQIDEQNDVIESLKNENSNLRSALFDAGVLRETGGGPMQ